MAIYKKETYKIEGAKILESKNFYKLYFKFTLGLGFLVFVVMLAIVVPLLLIFR